MSVNYNITVTMRECRYGYLWVFKIFISDVGLTSLRASPFSISDFLIPFTSPVFHHYGYLWVLVTM